MHLGALHAFSWLVWHASYGSRSGERHVGLKVFVFYDEEKTINLQGTIII